MSVALLDAATIGRSELTNLLAFFGAIGAHRTRHELECQANCGASPFDVGFVVQDLQLLILTWECW